MESIVAVGIAVGTVICGTIGIIYANLNNKTSTNTTDIKDIRERYVTKDEHNRTADRLDAKLDKIIDLIVEGRHER